MMDADRIGKAPRERQAANMPDYDAARASFTWDAAREQITGLPGNHLNIAFEAVDRHVQAGHGAQIALRWISKTGARADYSYLELQNRTNRFANVLQGRGIGRGDRVYSLLGRVPDLYIAALGTLKAGAVFCPLFSAFGPEPIHARMEIGGANAVITSARLYKRKLEGLRARLPELREVLLTDADETDPNALGPAMMAASDSFSPVATDPEETALLHFTSGTEVLHDPTMSAGPRDRERGYIAV